jgi:ectoine hydroxylase-related dioxygenase (phytanoyl-CoA dioxygenase family)
MHEIAERGFAIARGVVSDGEIQALRTDLERAIAEDVAARGPHDRGAFMVLNLMTRGESFVRLLDNDVLHARLSPILGDTCVVYAYTSSSMPAGGTNYSNRIHVDSPRFIPGYPTNVGITLALDDFTDQNGATYLLPGSHLSPEVPANERFDREAVRAYPLAGDAIVFNARTWHKGGNNTTDAVRHAVTMNVCRSYMRQQFDFPRMMGYDTPDRFTPRVRRFLGYDVRVPASLDEYYRPEEQRLYKPGQG